MRKFNFALFFVRVKKSLSLFFIIITKKKSFMLNLISARTAARAQLPQISQRPHNRTGNLVWRISALCFANKTRTTLFAIAIKACWRWRQQTGVKRMVRKTEIFSLILDANYPRRCRHWLVFNYSSLLLHCSPAAFFKQKLSCSIPHQILSAIGTSERVCSSDGNLCSPKRRRTKRSGQLSTQWGH